MRELRADLHVHTCLSPCAEPEMVPTAIVDEAKQAGLDLIGICDHNSAENTLAVIKAGERRSLPIIPGMEITSREEVHILGLFQDENQLLHVQDLVYDRLTGENDADLFGPQTIVDDSDNELGSTSKLLIGATSFTLEEAVNAIRDHGGLAIAAHIDRERFGLVGQLGFIPDGLELDAVEVSPRVSLDTWDDLPVVRFSDAHSLRDIGSSSTCFLLEAATLEEVAKALRDEDGRRIVNH
jgi:predicted metal-dependent phosphoesterase TrpH